MNKVIISAVLACGLLVLDSPEASAHDGSNRQHRASEVDRYDSYRREAHSRDYYSRDNRSRERYRSVNHYTDQKRSNKMPRWLKQDRSFRHWLQRSRLNKNRRLSWHQLFDIYRWEHSYYRYQRH